MQGARPTVDQDLSLHGPGVYPVKKSCGIPVAVDERQSFIIYFKDRLECLLSKARVNDTASERIMKKQIVVTQPSDQSYYVPVQARWPVILICVAALGIALVQGIPVQARCAGNFAITTTDDLSVSVSTLVGACPCLGRAG